VKKRTAKQEEVIERIVQVHVQSHERMLAVRDLLAMLDASSFGGHKAYRCLTPAELERVAEIRRGTC
jgi:hypothetical protein